MQSHSSETMSKIITYPNGASIYLSGIQPYYSTQNEFVQHKIKTIISILNDQFPPNLNPFGIDHYFFQFKDDPREKIEHIFYKTSNIIFRSIMNGENVLIHCRAGISRSVSVVIAFFLSCLVCNQYLIIPYIRKNKHNWTLSILKFIQSKRPIAGPNPGFMEQLFRYEQFVLNAPKDKWC